MLRVNTVQGGKVIAELMENADYRIRDYLSSR
jgi:hypothetical protein